MIPEATIRNPQSAVRNSRGPLLVWAVLASFALALLGLIVAAPLLVAHGYASPGLLIYDAFGYLCHQIPERSLYLEGHKLGVCSRCTGLYVGFALSVLLYPLARSLKRVDTPRLPWLLLAAVPIVVDWALGVSGLWANTHLSRFLTGALFSSVAAVYVVPGLIDLAQSVRRRFDARPAQYVQTGAAKQEATRQQRYDAPSDYSSPSSRI